MATPDYTQKFINRFYSRINITSDPTECWEWIGCKISNGYGIASQKHNHFYAHRVAYELHYDIDPGKMFVCHSCDNPACCNPAHLWLGTAADNAHDMINKGRYRNNAHIPVFIVKPNHIEVQKRKGDLILLSNEDSDLTEFNWYVGTNRDVHRHVRNSKAIHLDRVVVSRMFGYELADYEIVKHLDGNNLNNQRGNLAPGLRMKNLTANKVLDIRALWKMTETSIGQLAADYHVSRTVIRKIVDNEILE